MRVPLRAVDTNLYRKAYSYLIGEMNYKPELIQSMTPAKVVQVFLNDDKSYLVTQNKREYEQFISSSDQYKTVKEASRHY